MGAKTKTVGGTPTSPVAQGWNQFLGSQLFGQAPPGVNPGQWQQLQAGGAGAIGAGQPQGSQGFGVNPYDWQKVQAAGASGAPGGPLTPFMNMAQSNAQQPFQQQQGFQQAFQGMLGGNVQDISGAGGALQNFFQNFQPQQLNTNFANPYTSQTFFDPTLSNLPTNFGQGQTGMADISRYQDPAASSQFDVTTPISGGQFEDMLANLIQDGQSMQAERGFEAAQMQPGVQLGQAAQIDTSNPLVAAQLEGVRRAQNIANADLRARFGAEGAGALGTGAQFAEAQLAAELAPRQAAIVQQAVQQQQQQDLAERQAQAQTGLAGRGQDVQTALANMQGQLQGAQNVNQFNTANLGNLLQAATAGRGQTLQTGLGQMGLGLQQSQFNAGQLNNMTQAQMNAALQNQQMGNQFGLGAAGLNLQAGQYNNANQLQRAGMRNQFNLGNAQNQAQFGLGTNQLNANQQQAMNNFFANMTGQGLNLNQIGNANTLAALGQLFGSFQQANALGTPQAQVIQQPSAFGQLANAGLQLGSAYLGGGGTFGRIGRGLAGLFGRGGGQSAQLPIPIGGQALPGSFGNFGLGNPNLPVLRSGFGG
jgi:hypothetical protein